MYAALPYFRGSNNQDRYEKWKNHFENFFRYFSLTPVRRVDLDKCSRDAHASLDV